MAKKRLAIKNFYIETRLFKNRCIAALILVIACLMVLVFRLGYLQVKNHRFYSTLSQHNLLNIIPVPPNRGLIYDRFGVLLAKNIPTYILTIIPSNSQNLKDSLQRIKQIIPLSDEEINRFYRVRYQYRPYQPIPIKFKLTNEQVARFYVNQYRFPSVTIQTRMMRHYPLGKTMGNVVGYVGRINQRELQRAKSNHYLIDDDIGKTGIERYYENSLHGTTGAEEAETDASGHIVRILKKIPPKAGKNLYLTIDSRLQAAAEQALGKESGAVVVIQPQTGQVLALVTNPSYDPNPFVSGLSHKDYQTLLHSPTHPLYNRTIRGQFAAGSTMKPFFALFALDGNFITAQHHVYDPGWFRLPNTKHTYHSWRRSGFGWVNLTKAITVSSDVYFYQLAVNMGITRLDQILVDFGFGQATGIDLPEEVPGLVPTPAWKRGAVGHAWYTGDTIETIIGQGFLLITPLQLAQAVATLANRGTQFTPHLLLKTIGSDGNETRPHIIGQTTVTLQNPNNWNTVIKAMQNVVDSRWGTAHYFGAHPNFSVAAKTGTAQVYGHQRDEDSSRTNLPKRLRNNHLFIAFAPVNQPQIAIAVVVEHSAMADKMAAKVMQNYFHSKGQKRNAT